MEAWLYGILGAASVIAAAFFLAFLLFLVILVRKYLACDESTIDKCSWSCKLTGRDCGRSFSFHEIQKYSEGFSNRIGEGTSSFFYKGILPDGTEAAIKRIREEMVHNSDVEGKFCYQVDLLSRVHHQHLVNLVGYCREKNNRMLLFQYAPNGTLYENLHGDEHLSWKQRIRIAVGAASGLAYLHHSCDPPIIHGDFRSSHVFLTEDYAAKVGGLGKVPIAASSELALVRKTGASVDPETIHKGVYSRAGDVYSFGVLLLELISGRPAYSEKLGILVEWAVQFIHNRDQMISLLDPKLSNVTQLELYSLCNVACLCIQEASSRPCMRDILQILVQALGFGTESAAPISSPVTLRGLLELSKC